MTDKPRDITCQRCGQPRSAHAAIILGVTEIVLCPTTLFLADDDRPDIDDADFAQKMAAR